LLSRLRRGAAEPRRLAVVERVTLAPRQSLALVEADGRRFLVATALEGAPMFLPLDAASGAAGAESGERSPSLPLAALKALPRSRRSASLAARRARW
jgi:hypothetical protein